MVWSIDASFAVHMDMKSHTGYCLTLRIGSPISGSSSQKINTRSLTESELVGVDDGIGFVEWASLYSKEQVEEYPVEHPLKDMGKKTVLLQDNTSTIKMLKGGKRVCVGNGLEIFTPGIFLLTKELLMERLWSPTILRRRWCPTIFPNHYKVVGHLHI